MPDFTMCEGTGCPLKQECYRYRAKPSRKQGYFAVIPYDQEGDVGDCEYFLDMNKNNVETPHLRSQEY